jgi:toxin ParE1/3/4
MKRPVQWSPAAAGAFFDHLEYLKNRSPNAASLVRERVLEAVSSLAPFQTGRPGRKSGTFELYVAKTSLLLICRHTDDGKVRILKMVYTSRNLKAEDISILE